jgi:N-acyl-D-amino-acid deacylase
LVIRGGSVIDGTGAPAVTADIAISDGQVVDIGRISTILPANRVIEADGAVVCPGFIDLHSHADFSVHAAPHAVSQTTQGVTTLVTGNCGFSPFPVVPEHRDELISNRLTTDEAPWDWTTTAEFADSVDRLSLGVNIALQVGHGAVRIAAMGLDDHKPTTAEIDHMRELVAQAAADGAVGISTGLIYAPGRFADTDELASLVSVAASQELLYSTHIRDEDADLANSVREALEIARRANARLEISHLKASGPQNWGTVTNATALIEKARAAGADVYADQYPYTASSTTLTASLPAWSMDGGIPALLRRLSEPQAARRLAAELDDRVGFSFWPERIVIADTPDGPYRRYVGTTLADIAAERERGIGDTVADLLRAQNGQVAIVHHSMSDDDMRHVMAKPYVSVASDGWVLHSPGEGRPHPRSFGTFTRVLARYVGDGNLLELAEAIRKMTSQPANRLGWTNRGVIRVGAVADITVFDPTAVRDNATFDNPWELSTGVHYTLLSGTPTLDDGAPTNAGPGQVLR